MMKLKQQHITVLAGSRIIGTIVRPYAQSTPDYKELVLKEDITVWIEGQDDVEVEPQ